jgi:hypothetical protein
MAYRNDLEALRAQCDALQQELALAQRSSAESERLSAELQQKLAQLERAKAEQLANSSIGRRMLSSAMWYGVGLACLVVAGAAAAFYHHTRSGPAAERVVAPQRELPSGSAWFARVRQHCNPVEVNDQLRREPPPSDEQGQSYLAACLALAGKTVRAERVIDGLERSARNNAARIVFEIAHPIADRGDEVAAGPAMELVLRHQPDNDMALYHAAMAAHAQKKRHRANELLRRFLASYERQDHWRPQSTSRPSPSMAPSLSQRVLIASGPPTMRTSTPRGAAVATRRTAGGSHSGRSSDRRVRRGAVSRH